MRKNNIFIFIIVLLLIEIVVLSLQRSDKDIALSAEIRHFDQMDTKTGTGSSHNDEKDVTKEISASDDIIIDQIDDNPAVASEKSTPSEPSPQIEYEPGVELTYTVVKGDTLMSIAEKYATSVYNIKKHNHIKDSDIVRIGQKLKIIPEEKAHYIVRKGDTLASISEMFDIDPRDVVFINHLETGKAIWVGQKLYLPVSQERIDAIAAKIEGEKEEEIKRKKLYQRQLIARLARQKMERIKKQKAQEQAIKKLKAKKEKQATGRISKAKNVFKKTPSSKFRHRIRVAATAYTSHKSQTDNTPFLAAWNNRIRPGMKIIAVSPDLIRKYGITNGTRVKISGLPGTYVVRDKMNARLHDHIDIYMGVDLKRALRWGHRYVVLYY